jgi:hypothetical protein
MRTTDLPLCVAEINPYFNFHSTSTTFRTPWIIIISQREVWNSHDVVGEDPSLLRRDALSFAKHLSTLCSSDLASWQVSYKTTNYMHQISKISFVINSTCFGHLLCPSSGVICCTLGNWYVSCRLCGRFRAESGWNSNLTLLGSGHITCMKRTNCRVYSR